MDLKDKTLMEEHTSGGMCDAFLDMCNFKTYLIMN
jgi:hypothetical protein